MLLYVQLKETNRFKKCNSNFLLAFSRCFRFWAYTLARENILMRSFLATGWQAVLLSSFLGTAMGHRLCYLVSPPWLYCSAGLETNQSFLRNTPSQVWTAYISLSECSRASCFDICWMLIKSFKKVDLNWNRCYHSDETVRELCLEISKFLFILISTYKTALYLLLSSWRSSKSNRLT